MLRKILLASIAGVALFSAQFLFQSNNFLGPMISSVVESEEDFVPSYPDWDPRSSSVAGVSASRLLLSAKAVLSYDLSADSVIYEKNSSERLPMASLTKVMTAILALEEGIDKEYTVSHRAAHIGENAMGLSEGEVLTLGELLYGLLLPSGNDAAEVIAEGSKYGRAGFVKKMNERAKQMGLTDTNFTNPSGLQGDGDQYTTTFDLLKLTKIAMNNPDFRRIVGTYEIDIAASKNHKSYHLLNDTNLLTSYPGVKGVKTGFTWEAGMCLITFLEHKDKTIIAVILNSEDRRQEMKDLLDYSLRSLEETPPLHE